MMFSKKGFISHIGFFPFRASYIPFPVEVNIVLCDSFITASKMTGARNIFNEKVSTYEFGFELMKRANPELNGVEYLRDINPENFKTREIYGMIKSLPERISRDELRNLLPNKKEWLDKLFKEHEEPKDGYDLRGVCLFGVSECDRSRKTENILPHDVGIFGRLMNISHDADRKVKSGKRWQVRVTDEYLDRLIESKDEIGLEFQSGFYGCGTEEREKRGMRKPPCLAHSYERVMPGRKYVGSIRDFWRTWAGINRECSDLAGKFLSRVVTYPLYEAEDTNASEVAKVLENSYMAVNIAFIYDWTLRAEEIGIDPWKVLPGIRVRPTHNNIMSPGLGVGGYCLTKDSVLANWAFREIFGCGDGVPYTIEAIDINDKMPFHTVDLVVDALKERGRNINGSVVTILGASYLADVGDTRHSPSEILIRRLKEIGTEIRVHDPYVKFWPEFAHQDEDEFSLAKQFNDQEGLKNLKVEQELEEVVKGADAIVFAVRHNDYLRLEPKEVLRMNGGVPAIVDAFNIIDDDRIMEYLRNGCSVRGVGKGHIRRLKQLLQRG